MHAELGCAPLTRALQGRSVGRDSPDSETLRRAFRQQVRRRQRRSDGTLTVLGRRFELPARYRALEQVTVRYARWDLRSVDLIDPDTPAIGDGAIAPLLQQLIAEYAATGLPPAYIPLSLEHPDES